MHAMPCASRRLGTAHHMLMAPRSGLGSLKEFLQQQPTAFVEFLRAAVSLVEEVEGHGA